MNVVILGGGFCGAYIAKQLQAQKNLSVFLIDTKEYFEYYPSLWKLLLNPSYHRCLVIPYRQFLRKTNIITEPAINVTTEAVETKKQRIPFDYLVISTGIDYPVLLENTTDVFSIKSGLEVTHYSEKIANAKAILVIGGGLIGTEAAAELATQTPEKTIILLHPHDRLLERSTPRVSGYAKKYLQEQGVDIILGEKVMEHQDGFFITNTKRRIKADVGIWCAGIKPNPYYMKTFPASIFTDQKALKVNKFLQLEGYHTIFVGGDITGLPEEKTAANAKHHAHLISQNILSALRQKPLRIYKPRRKPMIISLGNWDAILTYPPFILLGVIPAIIKLLIEKVTLQQLKGVHAAKK